MVGQAVYGGLTGGTGVSGEWMQVQAASDECGTKWFVLECLAESGDREVEGLLMR